ncbi:MAG TPA: RagB/SusD family nutrient uptake outer membrane protein, partial [Anseongella sp.]
MRNFKQNIIYTFTVLSAVTTSCQDDFLGRDPLAQLSPSSSFNSPTQLELYTHSFYGDVLPGATTIYMENQGVDDIITSELQPEVMGNRVLPVSGGGWSWTDLRNINFFLQNYRAGGLSDEATAPYVGVARFFRAYFYFEKVKRFGDVPWYSEAIAANDSTQLLKPRDSRMLVVDSILADLDYAIANLPANKSVDQITRWTALALKSRVCLYEGTWRKYHADDVFGKDTQGQALTGWQELLQTCINASEELMENGPYSIYLSSPGSAYHELFASPEPLSTEVILARTFSADLSLKHRINFYTVSTSNWKPGLEKKLVNSYLMADGSRFTDQPGYETMILPEEMLNRDPRLSQTIRGPGYTRIGSSLPVAPNLGASVTGYQLTKFVSSPA